MDWITDINAWIALVTLTALEVVLSVDNVIFISIVAGKLPVHQQERARIVGMAFAVLLRVGLLLSLTWLIGLVQPVLSLGEIELSWRDLILIGGGVFLLVKSTLEIHDTLESAEGRHTQRGAASFAAVVAQIILIDFVFSFDSVITAIGMAQLIEVMVLAVLIAVGFLMFAAKAISAFVHRHPTLKMLALSFLVLIGVALIGEGLDLHIPKGYIYFAMAFSVGVEMLNMRLRRAGQP